MRGKWGSGGRVHRRLHGQVQSSDGKVPRLPSVKYHPEFKIFGTLSCAAASVFFQLLLKSAVDSWFSYLGFVASSAWKKAQIVPVFKKKVNYRPISLTSIQDIYFLFTKNNCLYREVFFFLKSTTTFNIFVFIFVSAYLVILPFHNATFGLLCFTGRSS